MDGDNKTPTGARTSGVEEATVGEKFPMDCVAVAHNGHNSLAMLTRRKGESLIQLLVRLDQAIAKANNEDVFTDEINSPVGSTRR
jgi:hypothetical protein